MTTDIDIWRTAQIMIKRYGDRAFAESEKYALQLEAASEPLGAATFRRITAAIAELSRQALGPAERLQ
ncbi:MAG: hypothetical protein WB760_08215 [Xanthobacteraceae bacterium]